MRIRIHNTGAWLQVRTIYQQEYFKLREKIKNFQNIFLKLSYKKIMASTCKCLPVW